MNAKLGWAKWLVIAVAIIVLIGFIAAQLVNGPSDDGGVIITQLGTATEQLLETPQP